MTVRKTDEWLEKRLAAYDRWFEEKKVPFTSKVIPIRESLTPMQWVLPTEQALEILRNARSFALSRCECRDRYKRCDNPVEVCFLINDVADKRVEQAKALPVSLEEAAERLQKANEHGLVHMTIYNPDQHVYALCSCCTCCCHEMQLMRLYGRNDLIAYSDYVSETDMTQCTHCGVCVERCVFNARSLDSGEMTYDPERCYGCGLCATTCPAEAIQMIRR